MKTKILILGILVVFATNVLFSQNNTNKTGAIETVGAGVIDFLLANPKTANKLNATEEIALSTLGTVLRIFGERKHEVNVATSGKDQIIINSNDGRQITAVMDNQGNMYLLKDGVIYPVASSLVDQAKKEVSSGDYDLQKLESIFNNNNFNNNNYKTVVLSEKKYTTYKQENLFRVYHNICDIEGIKKHSDQSKLQFPNSTPNLWYNLFKFNDLLSYRSSIIYGGNPPIIPPNTTLIYERETSQVMVNEFKQIFTCKWAEDLNGNGVIDFEEFKYIKKTFRTDEDFMIITDFSLGAVPNKVSQKIKIFDDYSGNLLAEKTSSMEFSQMGGYIMKHQISKNSLLPGVYLISVEISLDNSSLSSQKTISEVIEIVQ